METTPLCPSCGKPLPSNAPKGLCPECLMKGAFPTGADADAPEKPPRFIPPKPEELARYFPQLEILEFIGQGGMGAVYKVRQKELDRIVALKILPPGIGGDPAFAGRFAREAKALAKLNHPGIVTIYEFGNVGQASRLSDERVSASGALAAPPLAGGTPALLFYFLMEFVDGVTLRQLLHAGRISPREALAIVPQICDALQFAHDQGIVHRDIKPENILLDRRGRVKVADFGLAKIVGNDAPLTPSLSPSDGERVAKPGEGLFVLTDAGKTMGTPNYMAPEQKEHPDTVDNRADIYALGVVFYQMLTGELPGKPIVPPSQSGGKVQIDVRLDEVVLRALEKKPELRYQQVSEVKTMVETIVSDPKKPEGGSAHFLPPETPLPAASFGYSFSDARRWWIVLAIPGIFLVCYILKGGSLAHYLDSDSFGLSLALMGTFALLTLLSHVRKNRGRIVLVGVSNGKREINWTGVIQMWVVIYAAFLAGSYLAFGYWVPLHDLIASLVGAVTLITAALVQMELKKPLEQLPPGGSRRLPRQSQEAAAEVARSEKSEIGNRKSEIAPRFSRTAVRVAVWLVIIGGILVFALVRNHIAKPAGMPLSETEFIQKFEANQIEHATVSYNPQLPGVAKISGTYYRTDNVGNTIKTEKEVPFIVENALIRPDLERKLERSDTVVFNTPNPMFKAVAVNILFFVGFGMVILILLGIIIYVVSRVINRSVATPAPPVRKPDRFWRWFAVAVFAMIAIPFLISIVGLLAAIAIPNFVKARAQAQANAQAAAQMQNPASGLKTYFYIGQTNFPNGDSIEITSVERTKSQMRVKGHYNLTSADSARLALHITSTNGPSAPDEPKQSVNISKGHGDFELTHSHVVPGLPHVNMYASDGVPFAEIYFGTKAEAAEEGKFDLGHYQNESEAANPSAAAQNLSFGPVVERVVNDAIDFDSGKIGTAQHVRFGVGEGLVRTKQNKEEGWDIIRDNDPDKMIGFAMKAVPIAAAAWDKSSPQEVVEQIKATPAPPFENVEFNSLTSLPATYAFQTERGVTGIFQVTGFTEMKKALKLRYKLVQNGVTYPDNLFLAMNSATLDRVPPIFLLRPSTMPTNRVPGEMFGDGRYLARGKTVKELIVRAWSQKNSSLKIVFAAKLPEDKYDFIVTAQPQWWDSLQAEIDRRFHLVEQVENRDGNDVVVVKSASLTEAMQVNDDVARLKREIEMNELAIARKKFQAEVLSQGGKDLSASNIVAMVKHAYATIYSYRDSGWTVTQTGEYVWTNKFIELLDRRKLYRIEVVTAQNPFSRINRWWSDGETESWQEGTPTIFQNSNPASDTCNLSLVSQDSTAPALFYNLNWGNILNNMAYASSAELVRHKDEVVGGLDCYVLNYTNLICTESIWVGKQDFFIRRYRQFIPMTAMTDARTNLSMTNASSVLAQAGNTFTQIHENILVNEDLKREDFIPANE